MGIVKGNVGATYTSQGMIFVVLSFKPHGFGEVFAECLLLDDNFKFTTPISLGTVMEVGEWSYVWQESMRIASLPEQGKVGHEHQRLPL
jgi:hypothetical protein